MKAGFGWEHGPFQIWDAIGFEKGLEFIKAEGQTPASGLPICRRPVLILSIQ